MWIKTTAINLVFVLNEFSVFNFPVLIFQNIPMPFSISSSIPAKNVKSLIIGLIKL